MTRYGHANPPPGPYPQPSSPTLEQLAALGVGGVFLLLGLLGALEQLWNPRANALILALLPAGALAVACLTFRIGLSKLSPAQRRSSEARGPFLVIGLLPLLTCAPMAVTFGARTQTLRLQFRCERCQAEVEVRGTKNAWGQWLKRRGRVRQVRPLEARRQTSPALCEHPLPPTAFSE